MGVQHGRQEISMVARDGVLGTGCSGRAGRDRIQIRLPEGAEILSRY